MLALPQGRRFALDHASREGDGEVRRDTKRALTGIPKSPCQNRRPPRQPARGFRPQLRPSADPSRAPGREKARRGPWAACWRTLGADLGGERAEGDREGRRSRVVVVVERKRARAEDSQLLRSITIRVKVVFVCRFRLASCTRRLQSRSLFRGVMSRSGPDKSHIS